MIEKLLVTGSSGFLGWNLCKIAQKNWQVYGTYFSRYVEIPGVTQFRCNLGDFDELKGLFAEINPDAVIHTAAQSQPNYCQNYPEESYQINVAASANLAGLCSDYNIPCVFTSTDLVFDGLKAPYKENDAVSPISIYGEQKVIAEQEMLKIYPKTAVCRMPLMFGDGGPAAKSFIQPMLQALKEGKELALFVDEFRTPASGITASEGLLLALEKVNGIIHLGGKERISRYEFMKLLVEVLGINYAKITTCRQQDIKMSAPRPADVSLDSSLAFSLGYNPLSLRQEFERLGIGNG